MLVRDAGPWKPEPRLPWISLWRSGRRAPTAATTAETASKSPRVPRRRRGPRQQAPNRADTPHHTRLLESIHRDHETRRPPRSDLTSAGDPRPLGASGFGGPCPQMRGMRQVSDRGDYSRRWRATHGRGRGVAGVRGRRVAPAAARRGAGARELKHGYEPVTQPGLRSEELIRSAIEAEFPGHRLVRRRASA
jgi:hypothetical protein